MTDPDLLLMAYADGELDAEAARAVERMIADDPRAGEAVARFRRTAALLRSACGEQFYREDGKPAPLIGLRPNGRARRYGWAMAASVALCLAGFGGGAIWSGTGADDPLGEIAEYHSVFSREAAHLVELPPDRVGDLATWIGDRSPRDLNVPNLTAAGLRLAGGRMLIIDGERVAELMYTRDRGLPVGLCIWRQRSGSTPIHLASRGALRLASWADGGYAYVLVGELDADTARDLAQRVATEARS